MGMDYVYAGSASYPRFDREVCAVVKLLGGVETARLKERKENETDGSLDYWFGFMSGDSPETEKFVFPNGTPDVLVRWINHLYDPLSPEETEEIWELVSQHPEIKAVSGQIWHELQLLSQYGEGWCIS